jgi:hypothetical protein
MTGNVIISLSIVLCGESPNEGLTELSHPLFTFSPFLQVKELEDEETFFNAIREVNSMTRTLNG